MNENFVPFFQQQIRALGAWVFRQAREEPIKSLTTATLTFGTLLLIPIFLEIGELPQLDVSSLLPLLAVVAIGGLLVVGAIVALPLAGGVIARFAPGAPAWVADKWALAIYLVPTLLVAISLVAFALGYPAWPKYDSSIPLYAASLGPVLAAIRVAFLRASFAKLVDALAGWGSLAWNASALTLLASMLMVHGVGAGIDERSSMRDVAVAVAIWTLYFCALIWLATRKVTPGNVIAFVNGSVVAALALLIVTGGWSTLSRTVARNTGWANFTAKLEVTERGCAILNRSAGAEVCRLDPAASTHLVCPVVVRSRIGSPIYLSFSAFANEGQWPDHERLRHASLPKDDVITIDRIVSQRAPLDATGKPQALATHLAALPGPLGIWLRDSCGAAEQPQAESTGPQN